MTPKSKTLRRYDVRGATAVISDDGYFSVVSEFGDYAHAWWHGVDGCFRAFLLQCGDGYLLSKISSRTEYDGAATVKAIRAHVMERRRARDWTRRKARREWGLLAEHDVLAAYECFVGWYSETWIVDAHEYIARAYPSDARQFVEQVMPRIGAAIKTDLEGERRLADAFRIPDVRVEPLRYRATVEPSL